MMKIKWAGLFALMTTLTLSLSLAKAAPTIAGCTIFPKDNPWNLDVSDYPVDPNSAAYIANINSHGGTTVHPDFGSDPTYGIPYKVATNATPTVNIAFDYADESDPGPYPFTPPPDTPIESGGDHHILVINSDTCVLYETWDTAYNPGTNQWTAGSGAIFDLTSNKLRPDGWTSADAAGLPIFPGLAKCDEANQDKIEHAFRFTVNRTREAHIYPATHHTFGYTDPSYPPMGLRFRLKANYDLTGFTGQGLAIAKALKKYGMILADNGSNWYISGETNPGCWQDTDPNDELSKLKTIPGTAFEVIASLTTLAPSRNYTAATLPAQITLTWTQISWATAYQIQVNSGAAFNGAFNTLVEVPANPQSAQITLPEYRTYYWRIRAKQADGAWSTNWSYIDSFKLDAP
jgi:hypothetical protein